MRCLLLSALCLLLSITSAAAGNRDLTLEKIWLNGTFSQKSVGEIKSTADGEHYCILEEVEGVQMIRKYAYAREGAVSTLLENSLRDDAGKAIPLEGFVVSGNEAAILIQAQSERIYRHSMKSAYYLCDVKTKKITRIGNTKFLLADLSPDGRFVSYVRDNNLYLYEIATGKEKAVTADGAKNKIINGAPDWVYEEEFALVKAYEWSPDSKCIAYYRFDESAVKEFSFPVYGSLYPENFIYKYPKAGEDNARVKVLIYHLENGKQVEVKTNEAYEYVPRIKWVPTGMTLSVQFMNRLQNHLWLDLADRNSGLTGNLITENSSTYLEVNDAYFLKTRSAVLWQSERNGHNQIYYYEFNEQLFSDAGTSGITKKAIINEGDQEVTNLIGFNEETNVLYFSFCDKWNPTDRLTMMKPIFGEPHLTMPMPIPGGSPRVEAGEGCKYFVSYTSTIGLPLSVAIHDREGHPVRILEDNKALVDTLSNYGLVFKQFFKFNNRNGEELVGWAMRPADFNPAKKYPVLLYVYGGPGSQTVVNAWGGSNELWFQYLVKKGYIVASVDGRGTGAKSRDFRTCTYGQLGKLETEDQIDAAQYFAHMNFVDDRRIGIWGWSYGGYMSTLCLAKGADIFKMAIAVAPVTNWRYYDSIYTERYMGLPGNNGAAYDENSPITHAGKIRGKYLLVHGMADDNVHFQNTAELIDALVRNNVQFELAAYPNKNHGIYGGNTRYHLYTKMTDFIIRNL